MFFFFFGFDFILMNLPKVSIRHPAPRELNSSQNFHPTLIAITPHSFRLIIVFISLLDLQLSAEPGFYSGSRLHHRTAMSPLYGLL